MKKNHLIINLLIFFALFFISSCNLHPDTVYHLPSELVDLLEPWEGDIYFLEHELPKLHKNIYQSITKEEYELKIKQLKEECKGLEPEKQWVKIRAFIALINDSHTSYSSLMTEAYPLNLVILDDGVFVTAALEENRELVRTDDNNPIASRVELVEINGIPIFSNSDENCVYSILKTILSHENDSFLKSLMPASLLNPDLLYGAGITQSKSNCSMTFRFFDNSEKTISFEAKSLTNFKGLDWVVYYDDEYPADKSILPLYIKYNKETYYGDYYDETNTLYILYNSCSNDSNQSFSNFINELYSTYNENNIEKIVVDLRNNGGGDSRIIKPLYNLLENELSQVELYVITGKNTFSSALINAIELSKDYEGILIGNPTGGKPNHYGEVKSIQLPTGNRISWSTKYFKMILGDNSDSLYPDIQIDLLSNNFFSLKDSILDYIFQQ